MEPPTHLPWVGFIGAIASILAGYMLTPDRAGVEGALQVVSMVIALCLGAAPLMAGLLSTRNFFRAENIIALCPIYWLLLDLIQARYGMARVGREDALAAFNMIGIFYAAYWVGTVGRKWRLPKALTELGGYRPGDGALLGIALWMFVLGMMTFAIPSKFNLIVMVDGLTKNRWSAPWTRGAVGGWDAFVDHMAYFGYLLPTMAAMLFRRNGWSSLSGWLIMICTVIFFIFVSQSGSRRVVGACVMAAIIYYLLDLPKLKKRHLLVVGVLFAGLLWVMQLMLVTRNIGYNNMGAVAGFVTDSMTGKVQSQVSKIAVDDNYYRMVQLAQVMPKPYDYVGMQYVLYVLARPIPRVLWKNKPLHGGFALQMIEQEGASLSTTIIGECYMSYGFLACAIGGWLIGKLTGLGSSLFQSPHGSFGTLIYGYLIAWLLVGFRSMQDLMVFAYPLLALVVLSGYIRNFTRADSSDLMQSRP